MVWGSRPSWRANVHYPASAIPVSASENSCRYKAERGRNPVGRRDEPAPAGNGSDRAFFTRFRSAREYPQAAPARRKMANDPCRWKTSVGMANSSPSSAEAPALSRGRVRTQCNSAGFGPNAPPWFLLAFQGARSTGRQGVTGRTLRHRPYNSRKTLRGCVPA